MVLVRCIPFYVCLWLSSLYLHRNDLTFIICISKAPVCCCLWPGRLHTTHKAYSSPSTFHIVYEIFEPLLIPGAVQSVELLLLQANRQTAHTP